MIRSSLIWSALLGCALVVGCEKKDKETPTGAAASNPEASKSAASEMKSKAENASETAKSTASDAGKAMKSQAEAASDTIKIVLDAIKDKKWDIAESTLKAVEANKASLPSAVATQVDSARKMLDAAKTGAAINTATSAPSGLTLPK